MRRKRLKKCIVCLRDFESLDYACTCGVRFCSDRCMNEHRLSQHKRIAGMPPI